MVAILVENLERQLSDLPVGDAGDVVPMDSPCLLTNAVITADMTFGSCSSPTVFSDENRPVQMLCGVEARKERSPAV